MGFKKADVINLCGTMAELDFSDSLHKVSCPVLIVCGEKDNANKKLQKNFAIIWTIPTSMSLWKQVMKQT